MLQPQKYENPAVVARQKIAAVQDAIERVLGAEPGSLPLADEQVLECGLRKRWNHNWEKVQ